MEEKVRNQKKMSYWIEKEKELTNSCEIVIYWDVIRDRGQISLLQKLVNSLKVLCYLQFLKNTKYVRILQNHFKRIINAILSA